MRVAARAMRSARRWPLLLPLMALVLLPTAPMCASADALDGAQSIRSGGGARRSGGGGSGAAGGGGVGMAGGVHAERGKPLGTATHAHGSSDSGGDGGSRDVNLAGCRALTNAFLTSDSHAEPAPYAGNNLVFFLHVPRTAGRTFHSCLLKAGTNPKKLCPKAYDHLRINTSIPNCYLLTSHDDYSVVDMLPEGTAVLSHIRDPLDRFLSAYEFAIEVGARKVKKAANPKPPSPKSAGAVLTENVWPWSYLAPFFTADMKARLAQREAAEAHGGGATQADVVPPPGGWWVEVDADAWGTFYWNKQQGVSKWELSPEERNSLKPPLNAYDNDLVMSLAEFARHPIAAELLHNNQAYQVLGVTNYSHYDNAADVRACMQSDEDCAGRMLDAALVRLDKFLHVGVTDRLSESMAVAAASMRFSLNHGQAFTDKPRSARKKATPASEGDEDGGAAPNEDVAKQLSEFLDGDSVEGEVQRGPADIALGVAYVRCAVRSQRANLDRRFKSLMSIAADDGRRIVFSRAQRKAIPDAVIADIRARNDLDARLHVRAGEILTERGIAWAGRNGGSLEMLPREDDAMRGARVAKPKKRPETLPNGVPFPAGVPPQRPVEA